MKRDPKGFGNPSGLPRCHARRSANCRCVGARSGFAGIGPSGYTLSRIGRIRRASRAGYLGRVHSPVITSPTPVRLLERTLRIAGCLPRLSSPSNASAGRRRLASRLLRLGRPIRVTQSGLGVGLVRESAAPYAPEAMHDYSPQTPSRIDTVTRPGCHPLASRGAAIGSCR